MDFSAMALVGMLQSDQEDEHVDDIDFALQQEEWLKELDEQELQPVLGESELLLEEEESG